jgi:hypothetical protein
MTQHRIHPAPDGGSRDRRERRERRIDRILRWYPSAWREEHGPALAGMLMDQAEHVGRDAPSASETLVAVANGVGLRLDRRLAWSAALTAVVIGAFAGVARLSWIEAAPVALTAGVFLAPALTATALVALLRSRHLIPAARAAVILPLACVALGIAALTSLSWSIGFDLADAGLPVMGLAAMFPTLFAAGWALGALVIAVLADGLLLEAGIGRVIRWLSAALIGVVAAPMIGLSLITQIATVLVAAGIAFLAIDRQGAVAVRSPARTLFDASPSRPLAWTSATLGVVGIAYALTGSAWSPAATDGTIAMAQGIAILLAAAVPLLGAIGLRARRGTQTWGPLACAIVALGAEAHGTVYAPIWHEPSTFVAAAAGGAAVAWWIGARLPAATWVRVITAVVIGAAFAALVGPFILRPLAFVVPVIAVVVALPPLSRSTRTPRSATAR